MTTSSPSTLYRTRKSPARSSNSARGLGRNFLIAFVGVVGWCCSWDWMAASRIRCSRAGSARNCLSASSVIVILKGMAPGKSRLLLNLEFDSRPVRQIVQLLVDWSPYLEMVDQIIHAEVGRLV